MAFEVYRLAVEGMLLGQHVINVLWYAKPDGDPDGTPADLAFAWGNGPFFDYIGCLPLQYSAVQLVARKWGTAEEATRIVSGVGERVGNVSGPQLSPSITWTTRFIGRSNRGRTYLPGSTDNDVDDGLLKTGLVSAMEVFRDTMLEDLTSPLTQYVFSVRSELRATTHQVIAGRVNAVIRSQRRRTLGVGV